jgi:hypothetical protein
VNAIDFDSVDTLKNALLAVPLPQEIADNKHPGAVACMSVLRGQHPAHAADDAHVILCEG